MTPDQLKETKDYIEQNSPLAYLSLESEGSWIHFSKDMINESVIILEQIQDDPDPGAKYSEHPTNNELKAFVANFPLGDYLSASRLQRCYQINYPRAARAIEYLLAEKLIKEVLPKGHYKKVYGRTKKEQE
jgi:hypothetical protein